MTAAQTPPRPGSRRLLVLLPLLFFGALAGVFLLRLGAGDPSTLPSALIGREVPKFTLPPLEPGGKGLTDADLRRGRVTLVNVFASWCGPCHEEHPMLMKLAQDRRFDLIGINYKDLPENARRFIGAKGDPFKAIGVDANGRTAIDWGVYGVPETFVVRGDGTIAFKLVGPVTDKSLAASLEPEIVKALGK